MFDDSSSWRRRTRAVEEGIPGGSNNNNSHHGSSHNNASGPGVLGVQKKGSCTIEANGVRGGSLGLEEGGASEDDDPDI